MQLSSSLNGAPVAVPASTTTGGGSAGTETRTLNATTQRVPDAGVIVELSPAAETILNDSDTSGDAPAETSGNPLAPEGLTDSMAEVELFGPAAEQGLSGVFQLYKNAGEEAAEQAEKIADSGPVLKHNTESKAPVEELSADERAVVEKLKERDASVRAHEMAHVAAAGGLAGAPVYSYQTGPDGRQYAIGGSVSIDTSPGGTAEETIAKAQRIRSAALAPADPSSTDRAVASRASRMEAQARQAMSRQQAEEARRATGAAVESAVELPSRSSSGASEVDYEEALAAATPDLDLGRSMVSEVIPGGIATMAMATDTKQVSGGAGVATLRSDAQFLHSFSGGTAAVAQLYTPTERVLEAAFLQFAS